MIHPQPKPGKHKKKPKKTVDDKAHLNWVASQGCIIPGCKESPNIHHIRVLGEPRDHRKSIPLCWEHHQGSGGIHGIIGKHEWRRIHGHELDLLDKLMQNK